jgi:hypothetical protein
VVPTAPATSSAAEHACPQRHTAARDSRVGSSTHPRFAVESEFLRSFRAIWLELKSDNVEEMSRKILESGLVRHLHEIPDPHLYFQAPGGQCLRLVGIDEDLSFYEGAGPGPDVAKIKETVLKESMTN